VRGAVAGLETPVPIAVVLPAVYQEDEFVQRFVRAFDDGLAPVIATLDSLHAYVDPLLAPADFVDWLAEWVGVRLDDAWTTQQKRELVASAVRLHRLRGTRAGVAEEVRLALGPDVERVEVEESGGARWSATPGSALPGDARARLTVRVHVADPDAVDVRRLDAVVAAATPAHLAHTTEVVGT
jgi:phage tail-like protein